MKSKRKYIYTTIIKIGNDSKTKVFPDFLILLYREWSKDKHFYGLLIAYYS